MSRDDTCGKKNVMGMNVDGWKGRGRPKKRWMDRETNDMIEKGVYNAMTVKRGEWKR